MTVLAQQRTFMYCSTCGQRIAASAETCPHCGFLTHGARPAAPKELSEKKFGTAMVLCGVFGVVGVHHFYLGNVFHGLIDLGLFLASILLYVVAGATDSPELAGLAALLIVIDAIHSLVMMYRLIVGKAKDGRGRIVAYPGQF